jgi:hypothetical protein
MAGHQPRSPGHCRAITPQGGLIVKIKRRIHFQRMNYELHFGTLITFIQINVDQAILHARQFRQLVRKDLGKYQYNADAFLFSIEPNIQHQTVRTVLPNPSEMLLVTPDFLLSWADQLETTALQLKDDST